MLVWLAMISQRVLFEFLSLCLYSNRFGINHICFSLGCCVHSLVVFVVVFPYCRWDIFVKKDKSGELFLESQSGFRAYIKEQDITACSSVIHVLDNIILPVSKEEGIASFEWQAGDPTAGR